MRQIFSFFKIKPKEENRDQEMKDANQVTLPEKIPIEEKSKTAILEPEKLTKMGKLTKNEAFGSKNLQINAKTGSISFNCKLDA